MLEASTPRFAAEEAQHIWWGVRSRDRRDIGCLGGANYARSRRAADAPVEPLSGGAWLD